jgi:chemotaxis family two-component system sensor kinase Cph1
MESSPDAVSLIDPQGEIWYASASAGVVLGYEPEELVGRNSLDLMHPQDRDHCCQSLNRLLAEPRCVRMQVRIRQKNGHWRWVESTASTLPDDPRFEAILIKYSEISPRREEEGEKQRLTEQLVLKNAELQSFAHTVAHDLSEPLRTISIFTELLDRQVNAEGTDRTPVSFIIDGVKQMTNMLDDLLSSATRGFQDSWRPVDLEGAAAQAIENLRGSLRSNEATVLVGRLPTVQGKEYDLIRVFQNIIGNAVKYRSSAAVTIDITAERSGSDWVIRIHDNGVGISREDHRRVFGLFTRLHRDEISGTGVGLSVCKRIVEGLGGEIWVESELGHGATFCFTIAAEQMLPDGGGE